MEEKVEGSGDAPQGPSLRWQGDSITLLLLLVTVPLLVILSTAGELYHLLVIILLIGLLLSVALRLIFLFNRHQEELELLRAERDDGLVTAERYKTLTDNLVASIVIRDFSGRVDYCSPYTEVLTGYPIEEILKRQEDFFLSIIHEEDKATYARALKVSAHGEPFQYRFRFYHRSGIEMWAETRTVPLITESDEVIGSLSVTLDVTSTVRYQRQVEEKNRDMEDFTYIVSHDLKAPLLTIEGMAHILRDEYVKEGDKEARELIDHISAATDRMQKLAASILRYSRLALQSTPPLPVSLEEVLSEVLNDLELDVRERKASISISDSLPFVLGDRIELYQVLSNVIGNALKYSYKDRQPQIAISIVTHRNPRLAVVSIADNGRGIPKDKIKDIFRPFHRAHTDVEGSGIGLASVKKILDKIGGGVEVKSTVGQGSEFLLTFRKAATY